MQPLLEPQAPPCCAICGNLTSIVCCPFDRFRTALGVVDGYVFLCAMCNVARTHHHFGTMALAFCQYRADTDTHVPNYPGYMSDVRQLLVALHIEIVSRSN